MSELQNESGKNSPRKNYSTEKPCLACKAVTENGNTLHHIKTRGSGGSDDAWNLMPLCHFHHAEVHQIGMTTFAKKFSRVGLWLCWNNWDFDESAKKWRHVGK